MVLHVPFGISMRSPYPWMTFHERLCEFNLGLSIIWVNTFLGNQNVKVDNSFSSYECCLEQSDHSQTIVRERCLKHVTTFLVIDGKFLRTFLQFVEKYMLFWELEKFNAYFNFSLRVTKKLSFHEEPVSGKGHNDLVPGASHHFISIETD